MNKGEATRQRIIEQAAPLFNRHGYAGCSIQDLMEATGLEKGGIYRHFSGKEDLAAEALRYALSRIAETRLATLASPVAALDQLRHAVESFVHIPSPIPGGCPLMNTAVNSGDSNPRFSRVWPARPSPHGNSASNASFSQASNPVKSNPAPTPAASLICLQPPLKAHTSSLASKVPVPPCTTPAPVSFLCSTP